MGLASAAEGFIMANANEQTDWIGSSVVDLVCAAGSTGSQVVERVTTSFTLGPDEDRGLVFHNIRAKRVIDTSVRRRP